MSRAWPCLTALLLGLAFSGPVRAAGPGATAAPEAAQPPRDDASDAVDASAGDDDSAADVAPTALDEVTPVLRSATAFARRLAEVEADLQAANLEREAAETVADVQGADARVAALKAERAELVGSLGRLVSGIDPNAAEGPPGQSVSLESEITDLLAPLLQQLKSAPAGPRRMDALRVEKAHFEDRLPQAELALERLDAALAVVREPGLRAALEELRIRWVQRRQQLANDLSLVDAELAGLESQRRPFLETSQGLVESFFASRGRNVLLALLAFAGTFFAVRLAYRGIMVVLTRRYRDHTPTWMRLVHLISYLASSGLACAAMLFVLFAARDWVLLTLASLLLAGLAWGARQGIPRAATEMKLLLNLGPVREGERLVYGGLPWLVKSLGLTTWLHNPAVPGLRVRLPIRDLTEYRSRPWRPLEPWFPCAEGDYVLMKDGDFDGRIDVITPEFVTATGRGGRRSWSTGDFLAGLHQNLSPGFRYVVKIGVDYAHQADVPAVIPARLKELVEPRIAEHPLGSHLRQLVVRYETSLDSALELQLRADFDGAAAADYAGLRAHLEAIALETCVANGWGYAFPQLVVHKAD